MNRRGDGMDVALRVLTAITKQHAPDPRDLKALGRLAGDFGTSGAEELACRVIHDQVELRAMLARKMAKRM